MQSPAFQFYPKQWLGDDLVLLMSFEARGMHVHFMCIAWQQTPPCTLPDDDEKLSKWVGFPNNWSELKTQIFAAWELIQGRWRQNALYREYVKQKAFRKTRRANANARWKREKEHARALQVQSTRNALQSSSSSADINKTLDEIVAEIPIPENINTDKFRVTWAEWISVRRMMKKPKNWGLMLRKQLESLSEWGIDGALESLNYSIRNGYTGVFEPKTKNYRAINNTPAVKGFRNEMEAYSAIKACEELIKELEKKKESWTYINNDGPPRNVLSHEARAKKADLVSKIKAARIFISENSTTGALPRMGSAAKPSAPVVT